MKDSHVADDVTRAAVELFAVQGYASTSVQQIVEAAGVTKGAMYHYFESKDDLLFGIYDRLLSLQKTRLDAIITAGGDIDQVLRAACVDVIETSIDDLPAATVFFRSAHLVSASRQHEVTRRRRAYHDAFVALIEQGQAQGLWRTDIPTAVLVAHFFSDVHYLSQWYSPEGPESKTQVAEQLTDLFLAGISRPDAASRRG
ncbi:TetR/AcrR family transcriptional regulator [Microbacterium protaetiae]|uniref:TetR/AcrR family transcriptional regulator n=1 Tax=Microbacterium protaetiae TaxID=2509458 RepID=A0A4P6ED42_9MICO|nr:TetR/AcrR family transcriptional regulator [Microbacterium protaetiae]QAY58959.1 TetR/AcrR family transcriptional regulator [Microbacterium protaetiae]